MPVARVGRPEEGQGVNRTHCDTPHPLSDAVRLIVLSSKDPVLVAAYSEDIDGEHHTGRWQNFQPVIADIFSDYSDRIQ